MFATTSKIIAKSADKKIKILHLEHLASDALLIANALKKGNIGFEGLVVDTREQFVDALFTFLPDVIISDHFIAAFDSSEALTIFKQTKRKIPFILVTSTMSEQFAIELLEKGADDYVLKDRLNRLPAAINSSIEKFRLEKERRILLEELIKSQNKYSGLIENSVDGIFILSAFGRVDFASPSVFKILGYTKFEARQLVMVDHIHSNDLALYRLKMGECLACPGVAISCGILSVKHKNGAWVSIEVTLTNLLGDPNINGIINNCRDVTNQLKAEQQSRESEQKFRQLSSELQIEKGRLVEAQSIAKVGSWETDLQTLKVICSEEMYRIFEIEPNNFEATHGAFLNFIHPGDLAKVNTAFRNSLGNTGANSIEHRIVTTEGLNKYVVENWVIVVDANGLPVHATGTCQDITTRKKEEQQLKLLESVITNTKDCILITEAEPFDLPGPKIIYVNEAFSRMTGYSAEEVIGKTPRMLQGPKSDKMELARLSKAIRNWQSCEITTINYKKNGDEFSVDFSISPVADENGFFTHWISIQRDVSHRIIEEQERNSLQATLQSSLNEIYIFEYDTFKFSYLNKGALLNLGYTEHEIKGLTPIDIKPGYTATSFKQLIAPLIYNEKDKIILFTNHKRKNGSLYPVEVHLQLVTEGNNKRFLAIVLDITERKKAEKDLLATSERLLLATTAAKMGIWDWDIVNNTLSWDKRMYEMYGIEAQFFSGAFSAWQKGVHADDIERASEEVKDAIAGIRDFNSTFRVVWPDKSVHFIEASGVVSRNEAGVGVRMIGVNIDITERTTANEKVKMLYEEVAKSERFFKGVIDSSQDMITVIAPAGNTVYASPAVSKKFGYTSEECLDFTIADIVHPNDALVMQEFLVKVMAHPEVPMECPLIRNRKKDGTFIWVAGTLTNFFETEGINAIVSNFRDITEKKTLENLLDKTNRLARIGSWQIDVDKGTVLWSDITKEIYEADADFVPDLTTGLQIFSKGSHKNTASKRVENFIEKGIAWDEEMLIVTQKGNEKWIRTIGEAEFINDKCVKLYGSFQDINARKMAEMEVLKINKERESLILELSRSIKDLKQFSYITSHNFRAPLSNLLGLLDLVDYDNLNTANSEVIEMFKRSTLQLNKTINDLIQILVIRNNVNVDICFNSIENLFKKTKNSLIYDINEINALIQTDFSVSEVYFNKLYLDSIFLNLLLNAIKYRSPDRRLKINVSTYLNAADEVVLSFEDNGLGIDLIRNANNIFGLYQRFHSNSDGQGLGLFMVKSQVIALGGKIEVISKVGKGTTFIITFKNPTKNISQILLKAS